MSERLGDWMQTYTGIAFWPLDPRPEEVSLMDIAHGLAHQCRYNGHCLSFYSVAQHSVLVSQWLGSHGRFDLAVWGLLHDAAEAYVGDVIRPLKRMLPQYAEIEAKVERCIAERFGLELPMPAVIKEADNAVLIAEAESLMAPPPMPWRESGVKRWPEGRIVALGPESARAHFLQRCRDLGVR